MSETHSNAEVRHHYGPRVHILDDAWLATALARIGSPDVPRLELLALVRSVYHALLVFAAGRELPTVGAEIPTRMAETHPGEGVFRGRVIDPDTQLVIVDVIRGGIVPAQICFELLQAVLPEANVRLDHLNMSRALDDQGRVCGTDLTGSKVGGSIEGATLVIPDPMGATGGTVKRAVEHYLSEFGQPAKILVLPMISTPEFLSAVLERFDDVIVYTARLDRGLSDPEVLATEPGTHWDRERGLDDHSYIVPGAGGIGEVINNSWC
jgi:uracil phosphoribosyltransferase